jgi:long-chain acyl-CoA synthetase
MFWKLADEKQKNLFIIDSVANKRYDFAQIKSDTEKLAGIITLPQKGIIAIFCDNSYLSIISYLATLSSGSAALMINSSTDKSLAINILETYKPEIIIYTGENGIDSENYSKINSGFDNLSIFKIKEPEGTQVFADTALLLSTSGTTGNPKLVRLSYKNLQANAESIAEYLNITDTEKAITSLPMSYSFGLSVINSHILAGAGIVCSNDTIMQKGFWNTFRENECTSFAGVPYTYEMLLRLRFGTMNLPSLRTITQAGGKLSKENILKFSEIAKEKGFRFFVMYGATEATARIAYVPWEMQPEKAGSAGKAIPGGEIIIMDEERALKPNEQGEVVYKGDNVMLGYAESRSDLANGDEMNGTLRTGDIGFLDDGGYLYITGRLKRFSKITGQRINLDDVEKLIKDKLDIPCAALQNDDQVDIFAETNDENKISKVKELVSSTYSLHNSLVNVKKIAEVIYTSSGKKDYRTMKELFNK